MSTQARDREEEMVVSAMRTVLETYRENKALIALLEAREGGGRGVFGVFCAEIVESIRSGTAVTQKRKALAQFHQLRIKKLPGLWRGLYAELELPVAKAVVLQSVNRQLLNLVLLEQNSTAQGTSTARSVVQNSTAQGTSTARSVVMSLEEENAVRYASGYIAMKLMKQFEKEDSVKSAQFVDCLSHMAIAGEQSSFYAYTTGWLKMVDRGGLFHVNDSGFIFFRAVEVMTQACLPQHLQCPSDSSKEILLRKIIDDEDVQFYWSMLTVDIEDEGHSSELLRTIVQLWVTIRGFAITSAWTEEYKRAAKKTTKRSKGLRKQLKNSATAREEQ